MTQPIASFHNVGLTVAGENTCLMKPVGRPATECKAIITLHGHGGTFSQMMPFWAGGDHTRVLVEAGYQVFCIDAGGQFTWDNDTAMAAITAAYNYLLANGMLGTKVGVIGWSMGGGNALQWIKLNSAKVSGALLWAPMTDLDYFCYPGGVATAEGDAAYGGNYAVNSAGHKIANELTTWKDKCPIKIYHGQSDSTVPYAKSQAFVAAVNQPQVTMNLMPGADHTSVIWSVPGKTVVDWFDVVAQWTASTSVLANTVLNLEASNPLYLDTARTSPATADGALIASWTDVSSSAAHAVQATSTKRFALRKGILNGYDVLESDGVDDMMEGVLSPSDTSTIYIVGRKTGNTGSIFTYKLSSGSRVNLHANAVTFDYGFYCNEALGEMTVGGLSTNWNIIVLRVNSQTSMDIRLNGGSPAVQFDPYNVVATAINYDLGANNTTSFGGFQYAAVRRYTTAHTPSQMDEVGNYLKNRFNLPSWAAAA